MSRSISLALRQQVAIRADFLCEYCLIADEDTFFGCEVDHIISLKHGGSSELDNLAYAAPFVIVTKAVTSVLFRDPVSSVDFTILE